MQGLVVLLRRNYVGVVQLQRDHAVAVLVVLLWSDHEE